MILQTNPLSQYHKYKSEIDESIKSTLESGSYILGNQVKAFEAEFSHYIGCGYSIGVANGTDAIALILRALEIGQGDEVITTSHTAVASVAAIISVGAVPVLIDISLEDYLLDSSYIEEAITKRTKAIMPVHLYGKPVDMGEILRIVDEQKLHLIEDCSQAHGATFRGRKVGTFGIASAFSCYPTKNLGALGDAGVITTNDRGLAERLFRIRQYGWETRNKSLEFGINSRLDEVQASVLRTKLKYLDKNNLRRRQIANAYRLKFQDLDIKIQENDDFSENVFHQFVIQVRNRNALISYLNDKEIHTTVHYPNPIAEMEGYADKIKKIGELKNTKLVSETILSLPIYPELLDEEVEQVADAVIEFIRQQ